MTLVEVLVVAATMVTLLSISGGIVGNVATMSNSFKIKSTLSSLKNQYVKILLDDNSWTETVNTNANMACLRTGGSCSGASSGIFIPKDRIARNAFGYNPLPAGNGFAPDGVRCTSFSFSSPDPLCPIRVKFIWVPVCGTTCVNPEITVEMNFSLSFPEGSPYERISVSEYSVSLTKAGAFQEDVPTRCPANTVANGAGLNGVRTCASKNSFAWTPRGGSGEGSGGGSPPDLSEKVFNVDKSDACTNSYCSCANARSSGDLRNTAAVSYAKFFCKYKGYKNIKSFKVRNGRRGEYQAMANGNGRFRNAYTGNLACTQITCTNDESVVPKCPSGYSYNPNTRLYSRSKGTYYGEGCDRDGYTYN